MEQAILTPQGTDTGKKATLPKHIFDITPNSHVVYLDTKRILAHQRQGTHKTKQKGEVTASTRKIQKQKGTGNARKGSLKSGILRGGGNTFGPQPHTYNLKINKKEQKLARKSVLSQKAKNKKLLILEDFTFKTPKTKEYQIILKELNLNQEKILLILPKEDQNILQATKNLPKIDIATTQNINTYKLLNNKIILITETALKTLAETLI